MFIGQGFSGSKKKHMSILKSIRTLTLRNTSVPDASDEYNSNPVDYIRPLLDAYIIFLSLLLIIPVIIFEWLAALRHHHKQI